MRATAGLGLTPFAAYHWLMFGQSMWFDIEHARERARLAAAIFERRDVRRELRLVRGQPGHGGRRRVRIAPSPTCVLASAHHCEGSEPSASELMRVTRRQPGLRGAGTETWIGHKLRRQNTAWPGNATVVGLSVMLVLAYVPDPVVVAGTDAGGHEAVPLPRPAPAGVATRSGLRRPAVRRLGAAPDDRLRLAERAVVRGRPSGRTARLGRPPVVDRHDHARRRHRRRLGGPPARAVGCRRRSPPACSISCRRTSSRTSHGPRRCCCRGLVSAGSSV